MRTAKEWQENGLGWVTENLISRVQADARTDLTDHIEALESENARLRRDLMDPPADDAVKTEIEELVIQRIKDRRDAGRSKYGTTMERTDLSREQWLTHAQEEALDLAIYLEKLKQSDELIQYRVALERCVEALQQLDCEPHSTVANSLIAEGLRLATPLIEKGRK